MESVVQALHATISPDGAVRKKAEETLKGFESKPGFAPILLQIVDQGSNPQLKQIAGVALKNFVAREWDEEDRVVPSKISASDRDIVKRQILDVMCRSQGLPRAQISVALAHISDAEYPGKWPDLLKLLVERLNTSDFSVIVSVLSTINACFKKFRSVRDSDESRTVLRAALDAFGVPMHDFFCKLDAFADQQAGNKQALAALYEAMRLVFRVFLSFSQFDLPDVVEDRMQSWMNLHLKYLALRGDAIADPSEDDEPGPAEKLKTAAMENVALYAERYDEDFEPYFGTFADAVWKELTTATLQPKNDRLVVSAMQFLARAMTRSMHAERFNKPDLLRGIVDRIVVPSLRMREDDEERFEDDPIEFIQRTYEGSDAGTRRRAAGDVLREAAIAFHPQVTLICTERISALMAQHAADPAGQWKAKDVAITMFMSVAAQAETRMHGVLATNDHCDVPQFLSAHVLPELASDPNSSPMTKAACLRCLIKFRNQIPRDPLLRVLAVLVRLLESASEVVRSLAAVALERVLTVKDAGAGAAAGFSAASGAATAGAAARKRPRISKDDLHPHLATLLPLLFRLVGTDSRENEHVMRALMRVVSAAKQDVAPYVGGVLGQLTAVLSRVCANPSNPNFTHFLFESIAALIRNACAAEPRNAEHFERALFPPFQHVLQQHVLEVTPYVFQILAQLLELSTAGVSDPYKALFQPLLHPAQWENRGNIPALVRLLNAYTRVGGTAVLHDTALQGLLGVYQKLVSSRAMQLHGFSLVTAVVVYLPFDSFSKYLGTILQLMLAQLQRGLQPKIVKPFLGFVGRLLGKHGPDALFGALSSIQATLPGMVLSQIVAPKLPLVLNPLERKVVIVGMSRLLAESPAMASPPLDECLPAILSGLGSIARGDVNAADAVSSGMLDDDADAGEIAAETASYSSGFSQLIFAREPRVDPFKEVANPVEALARAIGAFASHNPGKLHAALGKLEAAKREPVDALIAQFRVPVA